jgi:hypothetical protein
MTMTLKIMPQHFSFAEPGTQSGRADFGNTVRTGTVPILGYDISFGDNDHHLKDLKVAVSNVAINGSVVTYNVTFNLRDRSNNKGRADVDVVVIADAEAT